VGSGRELSPDTQKEIREIKLQNAADGSLGDGKIRNKKLSKPREKSLSAVKACGEAYKAAGNTRCSEGETKRKDGGQEKHYSRTNPRGGRRE